MTAPEVPLESLIDEAMQYSDHHGDTPDVTFGFLEYDVKYCLIETGHSGESQGTGATWVEAFQKAFERIHGMKREGRTP